MTPFERLAQREFFGVKLGLDNVRVLTAALGHPERAHQRVIIAGTNGKGSVAAMTSRALHAAGHRVGLYTSPHLVDLTERYRIDERDVSSALLGEALSSVFDTEARLLRAGDLRAPVTYFELTTVAAFALFRAAQVDVAVLEVGLGGRFDATNVAAAPFAAITSVGFDHMAQLGTTLRAIAREKAGIIQPGAEVVSGVRAPEAADVVADVATACGARLHEVPAEVETRAEQRGLDTWVTVRTARATYGPLPLALRGRHQADNAAVAVRLLEVLDTAGIAAPPAAIDTGLRDAVWPGRLEVLRLTGLPLVVVDGAHNADGARALAAWLDEAGLHGVTLVVALMRDKDIAAVLGPLVARAATVLVTRVQPPRGLEIEDLVRAVRALAPGLVVEPANTAAAALDLAARRGGPIVVAGSLFLAGAALATLRKRAEAP